MGSSPGSTVPTLDVDAVVRVLEETPVRLAVLYGSHARAEATAASDIDLAVAFDESCTSVERTRARLDLVERLTAVLDAGDADVVPLEQVSASLRREICTDGIVLYGPRADFDAYCERDGEPRTHRDRLADFDALLADLERVV